MPSRKDATEKLLSPLLRWAGSKRKLLPVLKQRLPHTFKRYIEPFAGSACLFFNIRPRAAALNDLNSELIATYQTIRSDHKEVAKRLHRLPSGPDAYYKVRSASFDGLTREERAARFLYLNRYCFNGLYRTNLMGKFNVPYGGTKCGQLPTVEDLHSYSAALAGVKLASGDFATFIAKNASRGDFVYIDPPYFVSNRRVFRQYGPTPFSESDIGRLNDCLVELDKQGTLFLLSYADCIETRAWRSRWNSFRTTTTRNIAGFSKHRKTARELFLTNY